VVPVASRHPSNMRGLTFVVLATPCIGIPFSECKKRTLEIWKGNLEYNGIAQGNLKPYLYTGPIYGMNPEYARVHRASYPTLNLRGTLPNMVNRPGFPF
jgi:hypothetical protein